ncbi:MAG TPA: type II secretion system F family protein [Nitrospiria bacterium]|nr:type II secretion system F family protein [Nitrospiria bacterium]
MLWISLFVFIAILALIVGGYFLIAPTRSEKGEISKRLTLLQLRNLRAEDLPEVLRSELFSEVPLINQVLMNLNFAVAMDRRLKQANLEMKVGSFVLLSVILFFVGILMGVFLHWPFLISLTMGTLLLFLPTVGVNIQRRRRLSQFLNHFPEALEMFARSLRAGHSFTGAINLVGQEMPDPVGPEFQKVFDEQNLGIPLRQALIGMAERIDVLDVKFFVTAVLIQRETGGNLAEIIDKISYVIRERFRIQGQLRIYTAQARMTGYVLSLLPVGLAFVIFSMNPNYMKTLWTDKAGQVMIVLGVLLQIAGVLTIRKIIRIKI